MGLGGTPSWVIRENASRSVLLALYLREVLAIASPVELPRLRDVGAVGPRLEMDEHDLLERQWRAWWAMTVEPEAHPSPVPLELVDAYDTEVAFWERLTAWDSLPGSLPEFHVLRPPAGLPVRVLLQRHGHLLCLG